MIVVQMPLFYICIITMLVQQSRGFVPRDYLPPAQRQAFQNEANTISGSAQSGNFVSFKNVSDTFVLEDSIAHSNTASSVSGDARSGNSLVFGGGNNGTISDSGFLVISNPENNKATSQTNTAMSGQQTIFNTIQDSQVDTFVYSQNNEAIVAGVNNSADPVAAISGIETQAKSVQEKDYGNSLINYVTAVSNEAINTLSGRAVSGIATSVKDVDQSDVGALSYAEDNQAIAGNGTAIAGVQNNVASSNTSSLGQIMLQQYPTRLQIL
eukprot:TRINITY_DN5534_c0_g5_i2.p1 TRINITY_DN5534_c0_g5~~TRINITY_DN5534_c0_g5_i2.p1  ORF type:complete len:268 (+),score=30.33 TRINITY_DN5534_c0_g5_i2:710-1513(+)